MKKRKIWIMALALTVASLALGTLIGEMVTARGDFYKYLGIFSDVLTIIRKDYVDNVGIEYVIEGANRGLLSGLDPQSAFLTKEELIEFKKIREDSEAEPGLECLKAYGYPIVLSVYKGSSAEKAGIVPGDQILSIDGKSTRDLSILQCRKMMGGRAGTDVALSVIKVKTFSKANVTLKREKMTHSGYELTSQNNKIAYLKIYDLGRLEPPSLMASLKNIEKRASALLMDLRNCTSDDYEKVSLLASLFIERGPVLMLEKKGLKTSPVEFSREGFLWKKQMYVLINSGTAGALEGFALSLKEEVSAKVIGEKSYGMSLEPELITLEDGSGIILSTSRYITADGTSWNKIGVNPSFEIKSEAADFEKQEEEQLKKAFEFITQDMASRVKKAA